jgi:DNA-binding IclR family transcriptional regulator
MDDMTPHAAGPRTLRRGLRVLAALRDHGADGLCVTDLARYTGIQRPTIYRLMAALMEAGLALPVAGSKRYRAQLVQDAETPGSDDPRLRQTLPALRRLAERTGDAVFLVVRDGDESVSLHREIGGYPVQILATYAGKRQPLGVGSGGMALLAALPDDVAHGIVGRNATCLDEYGGMTPHEMLRLIENTRSRGYSVVGNHAVRGALGVGCALLDSQGLPVLAISVTAIIDRMPAQRQREIAGWIKAELARLKI